MARFEAGHAKLGGKKKGTPNRLTGYIATREALGINPFNTLLLAADNQLPCTECRGGKVLPYATPSGKLSKRKCVSCRGTGLERLKPGEIIRAAAELAEYEDAKRKAVELSGDPDRPVTTAIKVIFGK